MHGYATDQASPAQVGLGESVGTTTNYTRRFLERLQRINNRLTGTMEPKQNGPRPVPMGIMGEISDLLIDMSCVDSELDKIERALGIDQPPTSTR